MLLSNKNKIRSMNQIHLKFKSLTKKITVSKTISADDLSKMVSTSFSLKEKLIGVTGKDGKFYDLAQLTSNLSAFQKGSYFLVTSKDLNEDNMSFASQYYEKQNGNKDLQKYQVEQLEDDQTFESVTPLPQHHLVGCLGIIGDFPLFQEVFLPEKCITVVNCYSKSKPKHQNYGYYLHQTNKNSTIVYEGHQKICEFYIENWDKSNQEVQKFILSLSNKEEAGEFRKSGEFRKGNKSDEKKEKLQIDHIHPHLKAEKSNDEDGSEKDGDSKQQDIIESFIQNLNKLLEEDALTELEYYKLKSELLENPMDFVRKHQMGTRQGLRGEPAFKYPDDSKYQLKSHQRLKSREHLGSAVGHRQKIQSINRGHNVGADRMRNASRSKKYEIPIIVRKYNNVVQKISTSYPLSLEQEQAINLILELELKGLISEQEAGLCKSLILQEDEETFKLFISYFSDAIDQIELASKLRHIKKKNMNSHEVVNCDRLEHDMRTLIKYSKQNNYELLRKLVLEKNKYVLNAIDEYANHKNAKAFSEKLEKIAMYYRAKEELDDAQ